MLILEKQSENHFRAIRNCLYRVRVSIVKFQETFFTDGLDVKIS
jgi:hypothetical protein